jgi:hypothetical protein
MRDEYTTLVGSNEGSANSFTWICFVPATDTEYGRVCLGYDKPFGFVQGGVNEKGLLIDANSVESTGWEDSPDEVGGSVLSRPRPAAAPIISSPVRKWPPSPVRRLRTRTLK